MITIQQQPSAFSPVYNELIYVVSSGNTGNTNFKFVCDIWLEGGSAYVARVKLNTIPGTNQCVFDTHRIVENYISSDIAVTTGFARNPNSYVRFYVKFWEEYSLSSDVPATINGSATVSSTCMAYNGIFDYLDFTGYNYTQWQLVTVSSPGDEKNCLTNAPLTQYIELNQSHNLYFAPSGANTAYQLWIETFDSNNNLITGDYIIDNAYTFATDYHQRVGIGTRDLNAATLSNGSQPIITANVDHYEVFIVNSIGHSVTPTYQFYITSNGKYTTQRLHFMNKLGGFDAFNFTAIHRGQSTITRQTYRKNTGALSVSSWVNSKADRGLTVYDTTIDDTLHLISGYISEAESFWLEELLTSPEIYLESNGNLLPYVVTSNTYSVMQKEADKLINIEIDIQPAVQRRRQRG
jgi:hypothetical protein